MIKIGLLGGPSAGKTTLAAKIFTEFKERGLKTELISEFARNYINKYGNFNNVLNQYIIYEK